MNRQKIFKCWNHAKKLLNTKSSRKSDFITPRAHRILLPSDIQQAAYVCYSIHLQCLLQLIWSLQSNACSSSCLTKCYVLLHNHIWREKKKHHENIENIYLSLDLTFLITWPAAAMRRDEDLADFITTAMKQNYCDTLQKVPKFCSRFLKQLHQTYA